jgi:hypothetical protein
MLQFETLNYRLLLSLREAKALSNSIVYLSARSAACQSKHTKHQLLTNTGHLQDNAG